MVAYAESLLGSVSWSCAQHHSVCQGNLTLPYCTTNAKIFVLHVYLRATAATLHAQSGRIPYSRYSRTICDSLSLVQVLNLLPPKDLACVAASCRYFYRAVYDGHFAQCLW